MNDRDGQSFFGLVIIIGAIVVMIGVSIAFSVNSFLVSQYGFRSAGTAEATATTGAEDALLKIDRNAGFSSGGYTLSVGSTTATVSVTQNSPSANLITVLSQATVAVSTKKINVVLAKNASTSALTIISWQEIQ